MAGSHRGARDQKKDLFDRWLAHHHEGSAAEEGEPAESAAAGTRRVRAETPPVGDAPPPTAAPPLPAAPPEPTSTNVEFQPRTATRRLVGEILLVIVLLTALSAYFAVTDPTTLTIGLAATLGVLSLVLWAIRAGAPTARMSVTGGQLVVVRSGSRMVFDLASRYTPIEVVGRPRDRDWKVLFLRRGMDPFVIDSSMVDPEHFMKVLRQYRPE